MSETRRTRDVGPACTASHTFLFTSVHNNDVHLYIYIVEVVSFVFSCVPPQRDVFIKTLYAFFFNIFRVNVM